MKRFFIAWKAFWSILFHAEKAGQWRELSAPADETETTAAAEAAPEETEAGKAHNWTVYTLVLLQREGRFVDFVMEDIEGYEDAQIGAAVRQIHAGCRRVLESNFHAEPIRNDAEGSTVEIPPGFDPTAVRLIGNVGGEAPFRGTLQHRGWRVGRMDLPERRGDIDTTVICPAEVEL